MAADTVSSLGQRAGRRVRYWQAEAGVVSLADLNPLAGKTSRISAIKAGPKAEIVGLVLVLRVMRVNQFALAVCPFIK